MGFRIWWISFNTNQSWVSVGPTVTISMTMRHRIMIMRLVINMAAFIQAVGFYVSVTS